MSILKASRGRNNLAAFTQTGDRPRRVPPSYAARKIGRRFGLSDSTAATIAHAAGFQTEAL